jgi:adenosylcobinamide-GDP ribazoletransferase
MTSLDETQTTAVDPGHEQRRSVFAPLAAALQFLTVMPPLVRRPFTPLELGYSVGWFPLVGLLLGALLAGLDWLLALAFPPGVTAALVLTAWVLSTGALHLDGFLDTCDGLFGGRTPEDRLRIMRDERVGAFAVTGGILLLLLKYAALASNPERLSALIAATVIGRCCMAWAVVSYPYARAEGLGRVIKDNTNGSQVCFATAVTTIVVCAQGEVSGDWRAVVAALLAMALSYFVLAGFVLRRLPGLTGDVYGALCELLETMVLLVFVAGGSHAA